jgi:hypothetical protein
VQAGGKHSAQFQYYNANSRGGSPDPPRTCVISLLGAIAARSPSAPRQTGAPWFLAVHFALDFWISALA